MHQAPAFLRPALRLLDQGNLIRKATSGVLRVLAVVAILIGLFAVVQTSGGADHHHGDASTLDRGAMSDQRAWGDWRIPSGRVTVGESRFESSSGSEFVLSIGQDGIHASQDIARTVVEKEQRNANIITVYRGDLLRFNYDARTRRWSEDTRFATSSRRGTSEDYVLSRDGNPRVERTEQSQEVLYQGHTIYAPRAGYVRYFEARVRPAVEEGPAARQAQRSLRGILPSARSTRGRFDFAIEQIAPQTETSQQLVRLTTLRNDRAVASLDVDVRNDGQVDVGIGDAPLFREGASYRVDGSMREWVRGVVTGEGEWRGYVIAAADRNYRFDGFSTTTNNRDLRAFAFGRSGIVNGPDARSLTVPVSAR